MRIRVGTSGFSYGAWKGSFYPDGLPESKMLAFYAGVFDTCEINNTFYRMPKAGTFEGWVEKTKGRDFAFAVKAPVYLGFLRKGEALAQPAAAFFEALRALGDRLGPVLLQLPKTLPIERAHLRTFLGFVPAGVRLVLEAPHPSWHEPSIYDLLRARGVALCVTDADDGTTPIVSTSDFGYVRLRRAKYGPKALAAWASTIRAASWREAWVFFKHEDEGTGPRFGRAFQKLLLRA